jgi:hypothetical protein
VLKAAAEQGCHQSARRLAGTDIGDGVMSSNGVTPLHCAAKAGDESICGLKNRKKFKVTKCDLKRPQSYIKLVRQCLTGLLFFDYFYCI